MSLSPHDERIEIKHNQSRHTLAFLLSETPFILAVLGRNRLIRLERSVAARHKDPEVQGAMKTS